MLLVSSLIDQCILTLSPFLFLKETSDYNRIEITVEFQPGIVTQTVNVPIVDDMVLEGLEAFSATLIPNQPNVVVPDESSNADITIIDNDSKHWNILIRSSIMCIYMYSSIKVLQLALWRQNTV